MTAKRLAWVGAAFLVTVSGLGQTRHSADAAQGASFAQQRTTLKRARQLRTQHKLNEAATLLQSYLVGHVGDADALALLAQIKLDEGDRDAAQQLLVQGLNTSPSSPPANLLAGKMLLEAQQYPQAMDRFETVLATLPHDSEARQLELNATAKLAAQARAAGNQEAALKVFEHARDKMPDHPELLLDLGMQAFDLHQLQEAEDALQVARKLLPKDPDILYGLARIEIEQQHMPAAELDMRSYLGMRPDDASAHFGLGHIYAMEQNDDAARAEFERSIQLRPVQTESFYQIGQLDLNHHQDALAEPLFLKVIARDLNHGGALAGLGQIDFRAKRYDEAESYLQRAVKASPEYAPAHYYYGLVLTRLGKKTEAEEELRRAAELGHDPGTAPQKPPMTLP